MKDVAGKVAFITGGASGMGLAMARSLSGAGMKVVIADIEQAALDSVEAEFNASNAEVLTICVDVTDRDAMDDAARQTEATFGKVHVLCNNAGVAVSGSIQAMTYQDWDWVMGVNVDGVINGVQAFVHRIMAHGEGGHIVNTASMAGHIPVPNLSVYNMSKYAVVGMSEAMRIDLEPHNIGVSVLCPGVVSTNIFDSGRNRPEHLRGTGDNSSDDLFTGANDEETAARRAALFETALDASVVGEMVLDAIQNDDLYIFTHPHLQAPVQERTSEMDAAFERWSAYLDERD
jgi:NADP-dependent 3-hydroxy acid dehydrogenase YdfG